MIKRVKAWYKGFINNPHFDGAGNASDEYQYHLDIIKILIILLIFLRGVDFFLGEPANLRARYVETTVDGIPFPQVDLLAEKDPEKLREFAALVVRQTFDLDSFGPYKNYRNQINRVNSLYYRLTWESLNITEQELNSGFISDGQQRYYLVGQELTAMLVRAGIIKMLTTNEIKFWIDAEPSNFEILSSKECDPDFCFTPARQWDLKIKTNLNMVYFEKMQEVRVLPLEVHIRLIASTPMASPKHMLMVDRIATKLGA